MAQDTNDIKLGRFLSLVLRHKPSAAGITLDAHGWADVGELLSGVRRTGRQIDMDTLERIVRENNKRRYSFNEDHTKIRANQGHSIPVDIEGIQKKTRQFVHLSADFQTAMDVGRRHGAPVVIVIDADAMARDGAVFYLSENGVWLCDYVAPEYFLDSNSTVE